VLAPVHRHPSLPDRFRPLRRHGSPPRACTGAESRHLGAAFRNSRHRARSARAPARTGPRSLGPQPRRLSEP
jgi:hypothetical protein